MHCPDASAASRRSRCLPLSWRRSGSACRPPRAPSRRCPESTAPISTRSTQIDKSNVAKLEMAWFYPYAAPTFSPVFADGVLYGLGRNASSLVALDAATGKEIWVHEGLNGITSKGINYWESADGKDRRLIFAVDSFLQEIDARTGKSIMSFGDNGISDMRVGLLRAEGTSARAMPASPGRIWRNIMIFGGQSGRADHDAARRHPRLRRAHRQAAVAVPHDPASRRVRLRDESSRRVEIHRRREQLGRDVDRRGTRHRLHPDRVGHRRLLRRRSARTEPVRELPARPRREDRQTAVAFPDGASRPVGSRQRLGAAARDGDAQRQEGRRRRARRQDRLPLRLQPRHGRAALADRGTAGRGEPGPVGEVVADAAVPHQAGAVRAAVVHRGRREPVAADAGGVRGAQGAGAQGEERQGTAGRHLQSDRAQRRRHLDARQPGRLELGHRRGRSAARPGLRHQRQPGGAAPPQRREGSAGRAGTGRWRRRSGRRRRVERRAGAPTRSTARRATAPISAAPFPACRRSSASRTASTKRACA